MSPTLVCCAALAALAPPGRPGRTAAANETVIRLTVRPMPAPEPALRYLLLPELKEMTPGNPVANYLKCLLERDASGKEAFGRAALRQADRAARMDRPDWQILLKAKTDGINLLLPDVQGMRYMAVALQERFRAEVAQRRFDDALGTAKTMFALSRHMGENPTLIGGLVGIAIANIAIGPLEEMLQQPGCPNLYWALTNLPNPLVSLEKGMEGERLLISAEFHDLDDGAPMNADQIRKVVAHVDELRRMDGMTKKEDDARAWLDARTKDPAAVEAARRRLVAYGLPQERVARFPSDQVMLLDDRRQYEVLRDENVKLMNLPAWQAEALLVLPAKQPKDKSLFALLIPTTYKVRRAQARLQQRVALLQHVEALRMYAAAHDGRLPDRLADVGVPLPDDPFTGKPFRYRRDGDTANLRGAPPKGEENNPGFNVRYEVTIRK